MKHNCKILLSLFLISMFGAGTMVLARDLNSKLEIVQNGMKFLRKILNETDERRSRFTLRENADKDGTLQPEARNLAFRVREADSMLQELFETYENLITYVGRTCDYNKAAYNNLTKLDINSPIETKIIHLKKAVNVTSHVTTELLKVVDRAYEKIKNISATLVFMQEELRFLRYVRKTQIAEKFIEDTKAYNELLERANSESRKALKADEEFISRLKGTAESRKTVIHFVEKISPEDQLNQSKIVYLSDKITSALRGISDVCVEVKSG